MLQEQIKKVIVYQLMLSHYFNAVLIISSKITWLQLAATYQHPKKKLTCEQTTMFYNMRDGYPFTNFHFTILHNPPPPMRQLHTGKRRTRFSMVSQISAIVLNFFYYYYPFPVYDEFYLLTSLSQYLLFSLSCSV
jgi:hypothetical protein